MLALGCVTGRFQPVHAQHLALFDIALAACEHVIVAVTNPDPQARRQEPTSPHRHTAAANPFTYDERVGLIAAAARERGVSDRLTYAPFDLTRPTTWAQVVPLSARHYVRAYGPWERQKARWLEDAGYRVTLLEGDATDHLTASAIRACMQADDARWRTLVPHATAPLLDDLLRRVPLAERTCR